MVVVEDSYGRPYCLLSTLVIPTKTEREKWIDMACDVVEEECSSFPSHVDAITILYDKGMTKFPEES